MGDPGGQGGADGFAAALFDMVHASSTGADTDTDTVADEPLSSRFMYYECSGPQFVRLQATSLIYPSWEPVHAVNHVAHALAPRSLLRELRSAIAPESVNHTLLDLGRAPYCYGLYGLNLY